MALVQGDNIAFALYDWWKGNASRSCELLGVTFFIKYLQCLVF